MNRLAQLAAVALENVRALEREHQTAVMLQRSLLPGVLPRAVRDWPSPLATERLQQQAEVGGDFFDAFEVGNDLFLVIGDVQGHSLEAAVVMAELRYSLRAYAYDGYSAPEILARLDSVLGRTAPELTATACIGVVGPDRRSMQLVSAGHLPVVLCRGGATRFLDHHGVLLGVNVGRYDAETVDLLPGDRLAFVTDGLVERRTQSLDDRLDWFSDEIAATTGLSIEQVADHLLEEAGESDDDVALMIVEVQAMLGREPSAEPDLDTSHGGVSTARWSSTPRGVLPHRLPAWAREYADGQLAMARRSLPGAARLPVSSHVHPGGDRADQAGLCGRTTAPGRCLRPRRRWPGGRAGNRDRRRPPDDRPGHRDGRRRPARRPCSSSADLRATTRRSRSGCRGTSGPSSSRC